MEPRSQVDVATLLATFRPDRSEAIGTQITQYLRQLIQNEELPPGTRLPPTTRLALWWGVNGRTVHAALAPLVKEHLIMRKPHCGTIVRPPGTTLRRVAVYDLRSVHEGQENNYIRIVQTAVQEILVAAGAAGQVWMDVRPNVDEPWDELKTACQQRRVDAVVAVYATARAMAWLAKLPVPVTFLFREPANSISTVHLDYNQEYELALEELARRGCRSVGLISASVAEPSTRPSIRRAYEHFFDVSARLGLDVQQEWLPALGRNGRPLGQSCEEYGYRQFRKLWTGKQGPEGLFVDDDVVSRGVISAILEAQVRVPEELQLVCFRNREAATFSPVPTSFVELSLRDMAAAAVKQLQEQLRGRPPKGIRVPLQLCVETAEPAAVS